MRDLLSTVSRTFERLGSLKKGVMDSPSTSMLPAKRPRDHSLGPSPAPANSKRFRNATVLAPMVRSGALPTRLLSLQYGATLVWGPEIVDKAMLHARREVHPDTGLVSFEGSTSSIWSTHPIERPYLIYQIGTADPLLAVQAALRVANDVSGVDLNCGCPKPFSTSGGMGAALLDKPELICAILTGLRKALPLHLSVSCKIRLLPTSEATLDLVRKIVQTGISCLTVHCRTRNMRKGEKAIPERMQEIVNLVKGMNVDVAVLANGDCLGVDDATRLREVTSADGTMIATAAESNPSCFRPEADGGLADADTTIVPDYLRLARHFEQGFGLTKHCVGTFKSATGLNSKKKVKELRAVISSAKQYGHLDSLVANSWDASDIVDKVCKAVEARGLAPWWDGVEEYEKERPFVPPPFNLESLERPKKKAKLEVGASDRPASPLKRDAEMRTPPEPRPNPEPNALETPFTIHSTPALVLGRDERSPSPERPSIPLLS